ncbi:MAG: S-layer homology domain-containing protein [Acidimicrobiia bacterium]|nr:S-layer homology domain-containing protein [Acidimicrobiia bacterium]
MGGIRPGITRLTERPIAAVGTVRLRRRPGQWVGDGFELERTTMHRERQRPRRTLVAVAVVLAVVAALLAASPSSAAHRYVDVPATHPFHDEISWMTDSGLAAGFSDGTFLPGASVSRQAMAAFLYRLWGALEQPIVPASDAGFTDVGADHPFVAEIGWMAESGIASGYADGTFLPGAPVSRQAMAAFLARFWEATGGAVPPLPSDPGFSDVPLTHPFWGSIAWMAGAGITTGFSSGEFQPTAPVSRQAMSAFLQRLGVAAGLPARPLVDVTWTVANQTVVVEDVARRNSGLDIWVDGNIGFLDAGSEVRGIAANGSRPARWTVGDEAFLAEVLDAGSPIVGLPSDVEYAAGGPVYRDPDSGAVLLFYHGEKRRMGQFSVLNFWSFVGLAISHDDGDTFTDLGPIVTPHLGQNDPGTGGWSVGVEVGGAPYVVVGDYFHVYYRDVVVDELFTSALNVSVARAPVDEVVEAALAGGAAEWMKLGADGWDQPGLGGRGTELVPPGPTTNWFDVAYLVDHDLYVLVASSGSGLNWSVWATVSTDGIVWTPPRLVLEDPEGRESLYVSLSSPDRRSQRQVVGDVVHVYRTRSTVDEGLRTRWSGDVTIERFDLRLVEVLPPKRNGS